MITTACSGFPGIGKSSLFNSNRNLIIKDSDSSTFDKEFFPANYIKHIKENIGDVDILLVSSHQEVRDALLLEKIRYILVYPDISLKEKYLANYEARGNNESFIKLLDKMWNIWITDIEQSDSEYCKKFKLKEGEYLEDIYKFLVDMMVRDQYNIRRY